MSASRSSRRSARLAASALFAGFAVLTAVSACSAGQISQTSRQVAAVPGANLSIGDPATISLRDLVVVYDGPQGYPAGGSAPLVVRIFNDGPIAIKLVKVTAADAATSVVLVGGPVATPSPTPTAPVSSTGRANPSGSAVASGSNTPTAKSAPTPSPTVPKAAGQETYTIDIPAASYALLVPGQGTYLQLNGLKAALTPGQSVRLTFTFADGRTGTVEVPVGVPQDPQPRPTGHADVNSVEGEGGE